MTRVLLTALALSTGFVACIGNLPAQDLRQWFNSLKNQRGEVCCHNFDGTSVDDLNWRTRNGGYQVRAGGAWIDIPPEAVVTVPNRLGRAHIWFRGDGTVRCFIAGPLS